MNDDDDEAEGDGVHILACAECGSGSFVFTLDGRVLCNDCGGLLGPYSLPGAIPASQAH